jgi:hypothetical protein
MEAKRKTILSVALMILTCVEPVFALDQTTAVPSQSGFERQYEKLTVRLLLLGLDFEQYSLKYRIEALRDPKSKRTRYFLAQEAAAAGSMTAGIIGIDQTHKVLYAPEKVNRHALHNLNTVGAVTSVIGGSSSALELVSNGLHALKDKREHTDSKTAISYLAKELKEIDKLLAEREALLKSRTDESSPRAAQYQAETKMLNNMRNVIVDEHQRFEISKVGFRTQENVFYALNIGTSVLSALQYRYGYKGVTHAKSGRPSAICSTVSAAMVMTNPIVAAISSRIAKRITKKKMNREFGVVHAPSVDELTASAAELQRTAACTKDDPSCQATASAILDAYGSHNEIFPRELRSEIAFLQRLDQVAVQNLQMSQPIGAAALGSGVTSIIGSFAVDHPRRAAHQNHASSIWGVAGAGLATGLTGLGYVFETWNRYQLKKQRKLPEQLMEERITDSKMVTARLQQLIQE